MSRYGSLAEPYKGHAMSMDTRHAGAIGSFILNAGGRANVIEVGCCYGVSTAEVLFACEHKGFPCVLVDTHFQKSVLDMARAAAGRVAVVLDVGHSVSVLSDYATPHSIVILDGDHRREYMELESEVLERVRPRAVVLHDVTSSRSDCDGPAWMLHRWQAGGYFVAIDYLAREGERTDRGLAILCRETADAEIAVRSMCNES